MFDLSHVGIGLPRAKNIIRIVENMNREKSRDILQTHGEVQQTCLGISMITITIIIFAGYRRKRF